PTVHHVLPPKRWEAMTKRRSFMPSPSRFAAARGPCASSCLWRLPRPPLESPPGGRNDLPGWRSSNGDRSGVKGDRQVVPKGREERSETSTTAPLTQAEGGAIWGAPENGRRGSGCLAPSGQSAR